MVLNIVKRKNIEIKNRSAGCHKNWHPCNVMPLFHRVSSPKCIYTHTHVMRFSFTYLECANFPPFLSSMLAIWHWHYITKTATKGCYKKCMLKGDYGCTGLRRHLCLFARSWRRFFSGGALSNFSSLDTQQQRERSGAVFRRVSVTFRRLQSAPATFLHDSVTIIFALVIMIIMIRQ